MNWLRAIASELAGLFVDDAAFALQIVAWLLVSGLALPRLGLPSVFPPIILFVGLVAILAFSAVRRARR